MTFLALECRNNLPKVSYCTALDYYVAISFGFIFATIIQFAIVHHYTKVGSGEYYFPPTPPEFSGNEEERAKRQKPDVTFSSSETNKITIFCTEDASQAMDEAGATSSVAVQSQHSDTPTSENTAESPQANLTQNGRLALRQINASMFERRKSYLHRRGSMPHFQLNSVSKVDKVSRVMFPVIFLFINVIYWCTYLGGES
ncbi:Gamma-aminobutyric acid receptor alpha-like [Araneus ventricosus]|uniref:Gamma-aminobutyric acid receptor alpha-like n=1 Tax=Araneus ventricosus TaxID=182803 RepID=A0A4Y2I928_ARAVE|nr:Gamma-aminobutyric acid receptor alpha-like [Araneus ventricosus]